MLADDSLEVYYVPLDLPHTLLVAPLFSQLSSVLHRLSFSRIDRSQLGRSVRLPYSTK